MTSGGHRRLRRVLLAGAAAALTALAGCAHECTLIGCLDGLNIEMAGTYELGKTYEVEISTVTATPEVVPVARCTLLRPSENAWDVRCSSMNSHAEWGRTIRIPGTSLQNVQVTVSSGGTQLGQQMHPVKYTTQELNGEGCGSCTSATVKVTVP